jgi:hypothetical protein
MSNLSNFTSPNINPISGTFGTGRITTFATSGTFIVPSGITAVRVRMWGAGGIGRYTYNGLVGYGYSAGGGGGFAMKTITVSPGNSFAVTVGQSPSGSSSFGSSVSATGGANGTPLGDGSGGTGSGGDINFTGGAGGIFNSYVFNYTQYSIPGGGGAASMFGNGGRGGAGVYGDDLGGVNGHSSSGGAGGGGGLYHTTSSYNDILGHGGNGFTGKGGGSFLWYAAQAIMIAEGVNLNGDIGIVYGLDYIGTGGGGGASGGTDYIQGGNGANGGGAGSGRYGRGKGGFPGGGTAHSHNTAAGAGFVIVEY